LAAQKSQGVIPHIFRFIIFSLKGVRLFSNWRKSPEKIEEVTEEKFRNFNVALLVPGILKEARRLDVM
jgi:hypothetical protein